MFDQLSGHKCRFWWADENILSLQSLIFSHRAKGIIFLILDPLHFVSLVIDGKEQVSVLKWNTQYETDLFFHFLGLNVNSLINYMWNQDLYWAVSFSHQF